jgi:hypothetical protein
MNIFYGVLLAGLLIVSGILAFAIKHPEPSSSPPEQKSGGTGKPAVPGPAK